MQADKIILEKARFLLTIERLAHQLIENHGDFSNTCLIGLQPRGIYMADVMINKLKELTGIQDFEYGILDTTFYRDDYRIRKKPLSANPTKMDFLVEKKRVVIFDDVLFTGRTIRASLTALQHYGRPSDLELMVLIDRRFNRHLPIQANYVGMTVDSIDEAHIKVEFEAIHGINQVLLFNEK